MDFMPKKVTVEKNSIYGKGLEMAGHLKQNTRVFEKVTFACVT